MNNIKTYSKMMTEEVQSANKYIDMAIEMKGTNPTLAQEYREIANQELKHNDVLKKTIENYIKICETKEGTPCDDKRAVYEFISEINDEMIAPVETKIANF